jgi:hypothetical protein
MKFSGAICLKMASAVLSKTSDNFRHLMQLVGVLQKPQFHPVIISLLDLAILTELDEQ